MFRCWKTNTQYNEMIYLNSLQKRQAPLLDYLAKSEQVFGSGPKLKQPEN
jgi:hypothetical protein